MLRWSAITEQSGLTGWHTTCLRQVKNGGYPRGQAAAIVAKANPTLGPLFASQPVCLRSSVKVSADDGLAMPCGAKMTLLEGLFVSQMVLHLPEMGAGSTILWGNRWGNRW